MAVARTVRRRLSPARRGSEEDWRIVLGGADSAADQMALDAALAQDPVLTARLFTWTPPGISLGLRQAVPEWLSLPAWAESGCESVERPTGGGIAFHGSDVSVSVVVPRSFPLSLRELMAALCGSAAALCRSYGVEAATLVDAPAQGRITLCLAETSPYAVMAGGRKIAGFALRRYPQTWLMQGSLLVGDLPEALRRGLPDHVAQGLDARAVPLSQAAGRQVRPLDAARRWAERWSEWWDAQLVETFMRTGDAL